MVFIIFVFDGTFKKLENFYPKPSTETEKFQLDPEKFHTIKSEIPEMSSQQPVLGVPQDEPRDIKQNL